MDYTNTPYSLTVTFLDGYQLKNVEILEETDDYLSVSSTPTKKGIRGYLIPKDNIRFVTWIE